MGVTATAVIGYGVRIDHDVFTAKSGYYLPKYDEVYLEEDEKNGYPLLAIAREGFASMGLRDDSTVCWIFCKTGLTKIYSGLSGGGMQVPVNIDDLDADEFNESMAQLKKWCEKNGHEDVEPSWNMVMWMN